MSAASSCSGRLSSPTTVPPKRCARLSARSAWRLATKIVPGALLGERPRGQLARLAGAEDHDVALLQLADRAQREVHSDRGDADAAGADRGLRADPLARRQRGGEQAVRERPGGAGARRGFVGAPDLSLDLGLADDHRLEARRDAVELARGVAVARRVDRLGELGGTDAGAAREQPQHVALGLHRVADDEVDLGAVARRDHDRLADLVGRDGGAHELLGLALAEREAFAQRDRRGLVRDAEGEQLAHSLALRRRRRWRRPRAALVELLQQLAQPALGAADPHGHDREVDEDHREQHDVGGRDVLARGVQRQRRELGDHGRHPAVPGAEPGPSLALPAAARAHRSRASRAALPAIALGAARAPAPGGLLAGQPPQRADLRAQVLGGQLVLAERRPQQRDRRERDEERERHRAREVRGAAEHARVQVLGREAHGDEVHRHERAGGDREHRGVARLALGVLDREAQRLVGRVEQEHDQVGDERRLVPHPPVPPRALRPDRAGDQRREGEDQAHVDRDVGAEVPARIAGAQVLDREQAAEHEPAQRDDRERHVDVEDLLQEALFGFQRRVEEDERERGRDRDDRRDAQRAQAFAVGP